MTRLDDNHGCHAVPQLHAATGHLPELAAHVTTARNPSAALAALGELEAACCQAREWIAVDLMLIDGWSYADIGRALGTTRQAASKAYAEVTRTRMRRTVRAKFDHFVIVGCGGAKLDRPAAAGDMYTGSYHQACRRAAARIGGRLFILSARYGLLDPTTRIEPYELRMGQPGAISIPALRAQARALDIDTAGTVTVLAGKDYADAVSAVWPHAQRPLDGTHGIGPQMARLAAIAHDGTTELARTTTTTVVTRRLSSTPTPPGRKGVPA